MYYVIRIYSLFLYYRIRIQPLFLSSVTSIQPMFLYFVIRIQPRQIYRRQPRKFVSFLLAHLIHSLQIAYSNIRKAYIYIYIYIIIQYTRGKIRENTILKKDMDRADREEIWRKRKRKLSSLTVAL